MSTSARSGTRLISLALGCALALVGCPDAHVVAGDAGPPPSDGRGSVILDCLAATSAPSGAACDFTRTCFGDGMCGDSITWRCIDGLLVITNDLTCDAGVPPDAGPPVDVGPPVDGGACAPDDPPSGTACRSDADCSSGAFERCIAPGENPGCGICRIPMRLCADDSDCVSADGTTGICFEYVDPCSTFGGGITCGPGGDPTSSMCIPRCDATSCGAGDACGTDGRCAPVPCGSLYACPDGTVCDPAGAGDGHGCRRLSCTSDTDCPCGTGCVDGACHPTLGVCEPPRA